MAANVHRGELNVTLGGVEYVARPSFTAVVAWEDRTGKSSADLAMRIAGGAFTVTDLVAVLHAALVAGGAKLPFDQVGEMVVEEGQTSFLEPAVKLLHSCLTGGKSSAGEAEAAAGMDESPSAA